MSTLAIGTTIAATDPVQAQLESLLGIPAQFGRGVVIGSTDVPSKLLTGDPSIDDVAEAYVVQPQDADGRDLTDDDGPNMSDAAFVVVRMPQYGNRAVGDHPELGEVPVTITVDAISKSAFLASAEVRTTAAVDQFSAALHDDDTFESELAALLAEAPADDWDPEACDDDEPGSEFVD